MARRYKRDSRGRFAGGGGGSGGHARSALKSKAVRLTAIGVGAAAGGLVLGRVGTVRGLTGGHATVMGLPGSRRAQARYRYKQAHQYRLLRGGSPLGSKAGAVRRVAIQTARTSRSPVIRRSLRAKDAVRYSGGIIRANQIRKGKF